MTATSGRQPTGGSRGDGWYLSPPSHRNQVIVCAIAGSVITLPSAMALVREQEPGALLALAVGVPLLLVHWMRSRRRIAPHDHEGRLGAGLALPVHPVTWVKIGALTCWGGFAVLVAVLLVVAPVAEVGVVGKVVGGLVAGGLGVALLSIAAAGVAGRLLKERMLLLTADELVLGLPAGQVRIPWHALRAVRAHWTVQPGKYAGWWDDQVTNWMSFDADPQHVRGDTRLAGQLAGREAPVVDVAMLAVDPHLAAAVIRFYVDNPEARGELRTVEALDRVALIEDGSRG